jgi:hypothetical protein
MSCSLSSTPHWHHAPSNYMEIATLLRRLLKAPSLQASVPSSQPHRARQHSITPVWGDVPLCSHCWWLWEAETRHSARTAQTHVLLPLTSLSEVRLGLLAAARPYHAAAPRRSSLASRLSLSGQVLDIPIGHILWFVLPGWAHAVA